MDIANRKGRSANAARADLDTELSDLASPLYAPVQPGQRSCCCPAAPVVRVVLPPNAVRDHPVDLLLCGHHYQKSMDALAARGAYVFDLSGVWLHGTAGC